MTGKIERSMEELYRDDPERADAVVLSDYAKGVLTQRVIRAVIDKARELGKPVVVDPKGTDFSIYRGATLVTPNRKELADATRLDVRDDADFAFFICFGVEEGK